MVKNRYRWGLKVVENERASRQDLRALFSSFLVQDQFGSKEREDGSYDDQKFNTRNLGVLFILYKNISGHWPFREKKRRRLWSSFLFFKSFYWSLASSKSTRSSNGTRNKPMFPTIRLEPILLAMTIKDGSYNRKRFMIIELFYTKRQSGLSCHKRTLGSLASCH